MPAVSPKLKGLHSKASAMSPEPHFCWTKPIGLGSSCGGFHHGCLGCRPPVRGSLTVKGLSQGHHLFYRISLRNGPETLGICPDPDRFRVLYGHGVTSEVGGCGPGKSPKSTAVAFSTFWGGVMF